VDIAQLDAQHFLVKLDALPILRTLSEICALIVCTVMAFSSFICYPSFFAYTGERKHQGVSEKYIRQTSKQRKPGVNPAFTER